MKLKTKPKTTKKPAAKKAAVCLTQAGFNRLPPAKRAVMIAKDVIGQIALQRFRIQANSYLSMMEYDADDNRIHNPLDDVSDDKNVPPKLVEEVAKQCNVCAKGALFLSHLRLGDRMTVGEFNRVIGWGNGFATEGVNSPRARLTDVFDELSYDLIEVAFEGTDSVPDIEERIRESDDKTDEYGASLAWKNWQNKNEEAITDAINNYHETWYGTGADNRLVAIMVNIIQHKGRFVPSDVVTQEQVDSALKRAKPVAIKVRG